MANLRLMVAGALAVTFTGRAPAVHADGAFPDSTAILLPVDRPLRIVVGTNFGLVISDDGGDRWFLVCEQAIATGGENVTRYQQGPSAVGRIYALASNQISSSVDGACTWTRAQGVWMDPFLTDAWSDPSDADHVFALGLVLTAGGWSASSLFESHDGARSFGPPLYQAGQGLFITGVENAASAPQTLYLTAYGGRADAVQSLLVRSRDGGRSFEETNLRPWLGGGEPRIAAVDPGDQDRIYFRVVDPAGDKLCITDDAGRTGHVALALAGEMTAFLRRRDGTLIVGTRLEGAFISRDGGQTFAPLEGAPHLRALAERGQVLYAAADNAIDGFALAASDDGGKTWRPLLRFENLCGTMDCGHDVNATCAAPWDRLVELLGIKPSCGRSSPEDASASADAGPPTADAPGEAPAGDVPAPAAAPSGCACTSGGTSPGARLPIGVALWLALAARSRRQDPELRPRRWQRPRKSCRAPPA
jgi:MYXO-CTERM domain-containing protein